MTSRTDKMDAVGPASIRNFVDDIVRQANDAQQVLARSLVLGSFIDVTLPVPRPFVGTGEIRLFIIGQDPTVQQATSKSKVRTVLNLDRNGALRIFVQQLCSDLGLVLDQDVYATNAAKGFFTLPPTSIKEVDVLFESAAVWRPLLQMELDRFPDAAVISLGEPVLRVLARNRSVAMKEYWGHDPDWRAGRLRPMRKLDASQCFLGRTIFPFVHQPTMRGNRAAFYRWKRAEYISFIRREAGLSAP